MSDWIVETGRLRLRVLTVEDAPFVLELVRDPDFLRFIGDQGGRTLEDAERVLREGTWTRQPRAGYGQFLVELSETGTPIGVCGLLYREHLDVTDVGFAFLPAHRGHGYAVEAAAAVLDYGRATLGLERIVALTSPDNVASVRVLEKLGMRRTRVVRMTPDDPGTLLFSSTWKTAL